MIDNIFEEIRAERKRQDEKWGEQNHPMLGTNAGDLTRDDLKKVLEELKKMNETEMKNWLNILDEEVCEAFLETEPEKQREEMLQVAAVAVAIIECLDRRMG